MDINKSIREVWSTVAGIDSSDNPKILRFMADLIILAEEAKNAVKQLDDVDHEIYLRPFKKIEQAFTRISLDAKWDTFNRYLDDPTMVALSFCADTLSRSGSERQVPDEELKNLKSEIDALLEQVVDLDIPEELKTFLVEQLEKMRAAVLGYRMYGNEGLKQVLESIFGAAILHRDSILANMSEEKNKGFWLRFWKTVENLANSLTAVESIKTLSGPIIALLTAGK